MTAEWQRGYDLDMLKAYAEPFKAVDKGIVLGAFGAFKERDVAEAIARAEATETRGEGLVPYFDEGGSDSPYPVAALVWRRVRQRRAIKDFTGRDAARMEPGDVQVERLGCLPGREGALRSLLRDFLVAELEPGQAAFIWAWTESEPLQKVIAPMPVEEVAVKIPASSELLSVYALATRGRRVEHEPLPEREHWGLRRLALDVPEELLRPAVAALDDLPGWADHYSSYNKGHAWSALALRGFSDDPFFIVKPAEMSKGWKRENPAALEAPVRDTPLRESLPELEPIIRLVPGEHQRVRLMRLEPGGGELTRHADITDPEAGTWQGRLLRIHIPLVSTPQVLFSSWTLKGEQYTRHMGVGEAWYLDTRKPHTAVNGGQTERIHLVVDAYSSPALLRLIKDGGL